ncbi:DeoR/GlpR family DNA-binding transcription regulator [Halobacillus shinanisalinarum]|uniref:DeoR/GlpR family DNA-binding transcription regulator n=1 Tax=Halobacillus shinanisalinarum TaxID=2932258 RepID=A0ABY4H2D1_9BACI|nr:DeoR/GlpR family DNA-binding transcription regulator [Halobacillus shinanisalinarum]UOQ94323.1 DeoR/GlpR family DNA-binding transcription regulator [Halobacillus shinanisalinarum]
MLTPERHRLILEMVHAHHTVKIRQLVERTTSSESTIRRDLDQLEQLGKLKRVHGGASIRQRTSEEPSMGEKTTKHQQEKAMIASLASSLVRQGDCIFIDAGSTTYEMISYLSGKDITVVTNGLTHLDALTDYSIDTYVLGGYVKQRTRAVVGTGALKNLEQYRFDQCFLGVNGITLEDGFTTPDPEEAAIKSMALSLSQKRFVLADHSKFEEVAFSKIAELEEANIITNYQGLLYTSYNEKTSLKVVTT